MGSRLLLPILHLVQLRPIFGGERLLDRLVVDLAIVVVVVVVVIVVIVVVVAMITVVVIVVIVILLLSCFVAVVFIFVLVLVCIFYYENFLRAVRAVDDLRSR